jgi:hypothetical protein
MMKKITLALVLLSSCFQFTFAQNDQFSEAAEFAANHICDCVNTVYADIDADVRDAVVVMATMQEEEASNYVAGLDQDLILRIAEQAEMMQDPTKAIEFDDCNQEMEDIIDEKYPLNYEELGYTEEDFMDLMFKALGKKESCSFTYFLLQIGLKDQAEDEPVNNYHENQSPRKVPQYNSKPKSTEDGGSEEQ